jgi:hypothetical protein
MFTLPTLPKLLLIAAVIAVVWYFFRRGKVAKREGGQAGSSSASQAGAGNAKPIEDMVQCRSCGAYIPANTTCSCKKA